MTTAAGFYQVLAVCLFSNLLRHEDGSHAAHDHIWIDIVQIHQDDDREFVVHEARELRAKASSTGGHTL